MADQCYWGGEFYQCTAATAAGDSPGSAPTNWSRIKIPVKLRRVLARLTYANLLEMDGQKDKADRERAVALEAERTGLNDLIRAEANQEGWRTRPREPLLR